MSRHCYKLALRAKGIRPLPAPEKLRSSIRPVDQSDRYIDATAAALAERKVA